MPAFDFNRKQVFLTYAQCDIPKQDLLTHFEETFLIQSYCIAQELHEDGRPHLHAYFAFQQKLHSRDARVFDFRGKHPNIAGPIRSNKRTLSYIRKHDDYIQSDDLAEDESNWATIIDTSESKASFLDAVRARYPRDYVLSLSRIEYTADRLFPSTGSVYESAYDHGDFVLPPRATEWVDQRADRDRPKSLILVGATRTGKTEWARSLGRHIYFNSVFNLDKWDSSAEYAIFDDCEWQFIPSKKGWFGAQKEFDCTDKYRHKKTLQWGRPSIFLCNPDGYRRLCCAPEYEWLRGNA